MTSNSPINLVITCDNYFAILIAALVKSIEMTHKTSEDIVLYIMADGISQENRNKIRGSASEDAIKMVWFEAEDVFSQNVKVPSDKSAMPMTTYLRIFAPLVLPKGTEKLIYLDVDMILMDDISKLWNTDLEGKTLGAVQDISQVVSNTWAGIPNYKELGLHPDDKYFNAGLLIMDCKKWIEQDMTNAVVQCLYTNSKYVNLADQYGLNVVFANKWKEIDPAWNVFANDLVHVENPSIIHFLGVKPIFEGYKHNPEYQKIFYKYLNLTPWKGHKKVPEYVRLTRKGFFKMKKILFSYFK
jgi:lipopolysaccharide biosynthesis glycosyltransferase